MAKLSAYRQREVLRGVRARRLARGVGGGMSAHTAVAKLSPEARAIWDAAPGDYRSVGDDGVPRVLFLNPATGGTELWPVGAVAAYRRARCEAED